MNILALTMTIALLQPAPSTQPSPTQDAFLRQCSLDAGLVLKNVEPPFTDERDAACLELMGEDPFDPQRTVLLIELGNRPVAHVWWGGTSGADLGYVMQRVVGVSPNQFSFPGELARARIDGDWIVDPRAPIESRVREFAKIISNRLGREIEFERVKEEVDCVFMRGSFNPPVTPDRRSRRIELPIDEVDYVNWLNIDEQAPTWEFASRLSYATGWPVFDETKRGEHIGLIDYGSPKRREHLGANSMLRIDPEQMKLILKSIQDGTGFDVTVERREITRWVLRR